MKRLLAVILALTMLLTIKPAMILRADGEENENQAETLATHKVTFKVTGSRVILEVKDQDVEDGKNAEKPSIKIPSDYELGGFYKSANDYSKENEFDFKTPINSDTTIYIYIKSKNVDYKPSYDRDIYTQRVPRAARMVIKDAEELISRSDYKNVSLDRRSSLESALKELKRIAKGIEEGRFGKQYDGSLGRYYEYRDGYYIVNGRKYSYSDFYKTFGFYPESYEGRFEDYYYNDRYWDPYYGWVYGLRRYVEDVVDAIVSVAYDTNASRDIYNRYSHYEKPASYLYDGYEDFGRGFLEPGDKAFKNLYDLVDKAKDMMKYDTYANKEEVDKELKEALSLAEQASKGKASIAEATKLLEEAIKKVNSFKGKLYIRRAYMQGVAPQKFSPNETLTRAELAQILVNMLNQSYRGDSKEATKFSDVKDGAWYKDAVERVSATEIMEGYKDGTFKPDRKVTKEELITVAVRIGKHTRLPGNAFNIKGHKWSVPYIQRAFENGWLGQTIGFNPTDEITRGETVKIINGSIGYKPDREYIEDNMMNFLKFNDVLPSHPYFYEIATATTTVSFVEGEDKDYIVSVETPRGNWTDENYLSNNKDAEYVRPIK